MRKIRESLREEALEALIDEIQVGVGLTLIPTEEWISLYGANNQLLARVPRTDDPLGDVDHIRSVWFTDARKHSNSCWD